jgi:hypothetical protein
VAVPTAGELLLGLVIFLGILWLPLVVVFATGKLDERRERSNGNGQPL